MRVAVMVTCVNDAAYPNAAVATVQLLRRLGVDVTLPTAQTCCGQPFINNGFVREALPVMRNFAQAFAGFDAVVTPSGSCASTVRHQHGPVAQRAADPELQAALADLAPRVYELSEFIVDVLGLEDVGASFPHRVVYHPTCHSLRALGVGDRPARLLQAVEGLELAELSDAEQCCGFGGTFAVKNPDVSIAMGKDKVRAVVESGADYVIASDSSCLMHIGGILRRDAEPVRTIHLAEVLAATGRS